MSKPVDLRRLPEDATVAAFRRWVQDAATDRAEVVLPYDQARLLLDVVDR